MFRPPNSGLLVLLDFDGTLARIRLDPRKVKLSKYMYATLKKLAHNGIHVTILSSRPHSFLKNQFPSQVTLFGSKGNSPARLKKFTRQRDRIFQVLLRVAKKLPPVICKKSPCGAEIHFRESGPLALSKVRTEVRHAFSKVPIKIIVGRKTVEVIPRALQNKPEIVKKIMAAWHDKILFIGDDDSDAAVAMEIIQRKGDKAFLVKTTERTLTPKGVIELRGIQQVRKTLDRLVRN